MILITRPVEEAKNLKKELSKLGADSLVDSLISFKPCYKKINFRSCNLYLITSSQSVKVLRQNKLEYLEILNKGKFLVIGEKVASDLKKIAKKKLMKVAEDSSDMAEYLMSQKSILNNKNKIIFLSGSVFNKEFIKLLESQNINIKKIKLYTVVPAKKLKPKTVKFFKEEKFKQLLLFSSFTAEVLIRLIKIEKLDSCVQNVKIFSMSNRIDQIVKKSRLFNKTFVSEKPNQASLVKSLLAD